MYIFYRASTPAWTLHILSINLHQTRDINHSQSHLDLFTVQYATVDALEVTLIYHHLLFNDVLTPPLQ